MFKSIWRRLRSNRNQSSSDPTEPFPLDMPLWHWSEGDPHTIRDSCQNWCALGATGMGKTSGPAAFIAQTHLAAGFGGMFTSVKPTDLDEQLEWCRRAGRQEDVIVFGRLDSPYRFNFLDYPLQRSGAGAGAGITEILVQLLLNALELREKKSGAAGGGENAEFFSNAKKQILRATVDVLVMAKGRVTVSDIYKLIISAPTSLEQVRSEAWRKGSFCLQCLSQADQRERDPLRRQDLELAADYWCIEYPCLSDRTRTSITSTVTGTLDLLQRSPLRELLCSTTNFSPEDLGAGKVMLYSLNPKAHGETGALLQVICKYSFQRGLECRDKEKDLRPVFIQVDEFQSLTTSYDSTFATTCRSAKVSFGLLSQNLPVLYAALGGGDKAKVEIDALLGNTNLRIFCANGCATTNAAAAEMIGKNRQYIHNMNNSQSDDDFMSVLAGRGSSHSSAGMSEIIEHEVPAQAFTQLRPGGPPDFEVDTIIFRPGRQFKATGRNWTKVTFRQK